MAEATGVSTECGFCFRRDGNIQDPKSLPCGHVYCAGCLTDSFKHNRVIQCANCKETFDVDLDSLPSAALGGDDSVSCDICTRRKVTNQPAEKYCTDCDKKYCAKHLESHDDVHDDHAQMYIDEYRKQAKRLQTVYCTEHSEHPVGFGCKICLSVFCAECVDGIDSCDNGEPHKFATLNSLVAELTKDINELNAELMDKEEKLSSLFKLASKAVNDFETSTEELIKLLHDTRDEQIEALKGKYATLEVELITLRAESKTNMAAFMEDDIGMTLSELCRHRLRIEASLRDNHQVDIVNGYRDTREEIRKLTQTDIPTFTLDNVASLHSTGEKRDIELKISTESGLVCELKPSTPLPKSLTLLHTVEVPKPYCAAVCHHKGFTYVGQLSDVHKIDENYQLTKLLSIGGLVECIAVYKDQLYVLTSSSSTYTIYVYSLTGQLVTQWSYTDDVKQYNKLAVLSDQVVVPDRTNKGFIIYSLTGDTLRHIHCPQLSIFTISQCVVDDDTVIVSDRGSSQVFRMNVTTGEVIWTSTDVTNPQGVTCYGQDYVCVTSLDSDKIHILNTQTGKPLTQVTLTESCVAVDLHIFGSTLVVPSLLDNKVMFYKLEN